MKSPSEIVIYDSGEAGVEVRVERDNVWLSLQQLTELFGRDKSVISRHLKNVFATGELERDSVVAKNATTAADGKTYQVEYFNLDAIISVGYRVSSTRATRFRQWATRILREHLTQGYTLNRQRFEQNAAELEAALKLVKKAAAGEALTTDQGRGLVDVIARYTHTFLWLQRYDEGLLTQPEGSPGGVLPAHKEACVGIARLKSDLMSRGEATDLVAANGAMPSRPQSAISRKPCLVSPPIPRSKPKPRTCCISSSRITRSPTATSALAPTCSSIASRGTAGFCAGLNPSSTTWASQHSPCWWPNPTPKPRT